MTYQQIIGTSNENTSFTSKNMLQDTDSNNLCHETFEEYEYLMNVVGHFWLEGVLLLVIGLFGVAGNIMTIIVLRKMDSNATFNRLLMSLGK